MHRSRPTPMTLVVAIALVLALSSLSPVLGPSPAEAQNTVVSTTTVGLDAHLARTETVVQVGDDPLARFVVTRLRRAGTGDLDRPVLLLPPLGNGFEFYAEPEDAGGDGGGLASSFAGRLAIRGYDVWGYSPRTAGIAAGTCESGAADCAGFDGWGLAGQVDDVLSIREQIVAARGQNPVLGGYSLGGMLTLASLDARPDGWAGAMVLEGTIFTSDPAVRALNLPFCQIYEGLLAAGIVADGQTPGMIKLTAQLAALAPDAPTPIPGFPPGTTNHQVLVALLALPADNPLSPTEEFIRLVGSFEDDVFTYADDERVIRVTQLFYDYVANRTIRDISCSLAGVETSFTDDLGSYDGPVYVLGGGLGFGPLLEQTVPLLGSTDVTWNLIPEFGHADHWFARFHRSVLENDILDWLRDLD